MEKPRHAAGYTSDHADLCERVLVTHLRKRFAGDNKTDGHRKDGPRAYARFFADPSLPAQGLVLRRQAAATVEQFLNQIKNWK